MKELCVSEPLLTVDEVSYILNVSEQTVRKLIKNNELKSVKFGRTYRVTTESLNQFVMDKQG